MIDADDIESPEVTLPIVGEGTPIGADVLCVACSAKLDFTDLALECIAFQRMCEVQQSVVTCPACSARMAIFAVGDMPVQSSPEVVIVGPPSEGFRIALLTPPPTGSGPGTRPSKETKP